jgi:hypothetical protein
MTISILAEKICNRIRVQSFAETDLAKTLERLPKPSSEGPWIAGGAVRRTIQCKTLDSDFDFFFASADQTEKFAADLVSLGGQLRGKNEKNQTYILPSKVVGGDNETPLTQLPELKIQLITFQYFASAEQVIDSFDFTLCQFAYDGSKLYMGDFSLWDVARKRLVPNRISYATSSLRRLLKYANQGFTVCGGALSEILQQVVQNPQIIEADTLYID